MRRRLLLSILLIISIGIGIGISARWSGAEMALVANPSLANAETAPVISKSQAESAQVVEQPVVTPTEESRDEIWPRTISVDLAERMLEQIDQTAAGNLLSGWLHIQQEKVIDSDQPNNGVMPGGVSIPNHQFSDLWYRLEDGLVVEFVTIMRDETGQVVQVGVFSNGTVWNSVFRTSEPLDPFVIDFLDGNFLRDLRSQVKNGAVTVVMFKEVILTNGNPGYHFAILDSNEIPQGTVDFDKPISGIKTEVLIDALTGFMQENMITSYQADGQQRTFLHHTQVVEFAEPSEEVNYYLIEKENAEGG